MNPWKDKISVEDRSISIIIVVFRGGKEKFSSLREERVQAAPYNRAIIDSDESTVIMGAQEEDTKSSTIGGVLPVVEVVTLVEKAKFYTSLCLGTTAILAVFAFLFLIPFVVEPAVTTILADFSPHAVACVVTDHVYAEGLKNCSWASCREGTGQIPRFEFTFERAG